MTPTATLAGLEYRPDRHQYFYQGSQLPGFTRVLSSLGYYGAGKAFYTENSRQRGQAVHKATELIDQHHPNATDIDEIACSDRIEIHPEILPYSAGYVLFKRETGYQPIHHETPMCSVKMRAAGTPDGLGLERSTGRRIILDLKSWKSQGAKPKISSEIQTAGYKIMAKEYMGFETDERWVLKLPGDGSYRIYLCDQTDSEEIAMYCCRVWWNQKQHGIVSLAGEEDETITTGE